MEQHDAYDSHHIFNVDQEGSRIMKTHKLGWNPNVVLTELEYSIYYPLSRANVSTDD